MKLFNVLVHLLTETSRHAGHADILREELDGHVGTGLTGTILHGQDREYWAAHRAPPGLLTIRIASDESIACD
ncbi:mycothiol transferase [Kribbella sp. WER1]